MAAIVVGTSTESFVVCAGSAHRYESKERIEATAATMDATAEMTQMTVLMMNLLFSVRSLEALVSTS